MYSIMAQHLHVTIFNSILYINNNTIETTMHANDVINYIKYWNTVINDFCKMLHTLLLVPFISQYNSTKQLCVQALFSQFDKNLNLMVTLNI